MPATQPSPPALPAQPAAQALLRVEGLRTTFATPDGEARAVDGVSFEIGAAETVGLVGESGCGKSVTALSILRLVRPPGRIEADSRILFDHRNLLELAEREMREIRGARIAMVFQEPMTALNPVFTVGYQVAEVVRVHAGASRHEAWAKAVEMLEIVGMPAPAQRAREYPHQLSGGMRQRVMIAMALVMQPQLVIADEPTTALDVTIQAQILELLGDLQRRFDTSILLITHDLGVVAESTSRVIVMYAGEIVEEAEVTTLFANAQHPYTQGLLAAMPRLGQQRDRLLTIPGAVPSPTAWPAGCRFHDRCPYAWERCRSEHPPLYEIARSSQRRHVARCHLVAEPQRREQAHEPWVTGAVPGAAAGVPR